MNTITANGQNLCPFTVELKRMKLNSKKIFMQSVPQR